MSGSFAQSLQWTLTAEGCQQVRSLLWQSTLDCLQELGNLPESGAIATEGDATIGKRQQPAFALVTGPGLAWLLTMERSSEGETPTGMATEAPESSMRRGRGRGHKANGRGPIEDPAATTHQTLRQGLDQTTLHPGIYHLRLTDDRRAIQALMKERGLLKVPQGWHKANASLQSAVLVRWLATWTQTLAAPLLTPAPAPRPSPTRLEGDRHLIDLLVGIVQEQELPVVIDRALQTLCQGLRVDRALIYQFQARLQSIRLWRQADQAAGLPSPWDDPNWQMTRDCVTYEARLDDQVGSVLYEGADRCFVDDFEPQWRSQEQETWIVNDGGRDRAARAQLAVPILAPMRGSVGLWGFLVLHQCDQARLWTPEEVSLAQQIAQGLAVAVRAAHLDATLQQQQQTLGQQISTQTRVLQEALLAAKSAARAKSEFLATISHELRTPLTCVIGLSATLLRWSFGQLNQKQRDYLQTIHDSGEHLLKLIEDLLEMSQVEAGRTVLNVSDFSITQLVYSVVNGERPHAIERGIELLLEVQILTKDDRFSADCHRVRQILSNLLGNAIKFTPEGGQAIVRVWREQDLLMLQVEDTGIGIPEDWIPQLFEMFHQFDPSYGRVYDGLGLGLALTKQLVDLHKGWIEVDSLPDRGSTFTVGIPSQAPAAEQPTAPNGEEPVDWRPSGSVILIDAQEERAIAVCELLMAAGYQVVWTPDGAIALSQLDVLQPQVVIVSLRLPGMDGWEVVAGLRRQAPRVQVLLLGDRAEASPILVDHPNLTVDVVLGEKFDPERLLHEVNTLSQAAARAMRMNSQATGVMTRARSPLADRSNER
ncbi:ATP-binding protein [Limnothrix sp. PR1529]|uniref:ATP-binding protein n=1 Tax=Limnothrix sp. PR1529 TaxID=1704291 RepID=UPI00081ED1B2|nr:ATP-binding protein [Limnothrix sp. PR1529]OCQ97583.1 hypothetical protein BCR12_04930 [Limnothrix sp. P13C2]